MTYQLSRALGLQLYGNEKLQLEVASIMGSDFVEECIDLAITKCPPEANNVVKAAHSYAYRFKHKTKAAQDQTKTVYPKK